HEAAARHRVAAYLDDATVWPRTLEPHFPPGIVEAAAQLLFEIGRDVLAAVSEIAEIFGKARPIYQEGVRELKHLLEIAVPRGQARLCIEHDNAVAHVVEGDAQFGLALTQFLEESRVLDCYHRLIGEGGDEIDLFSCEGLHARAVNREYA